VIHALLATLQLAARIAARGDSLSLHPTWTPPPGMALEHATGGKPEQNA
jgi:hypothetical protein